jgi:hypothetical protein
MSIERSLLEYLDCNAGLAGKWRIAGGWARDQILGRRAKDIDVFAVQSPEATNIITANFGRHNIPCMVEPKEYNKMTFWNEAPDRPKFDAPVRFRYLDYNVHLVATSAPDLDAILGSFDYNICRFAVEFDCNDDAIYVPYLDSDLVDLHAKNMRLMHNLTPLSSLRRGFLFADRLGMTFLAGDIRTLITTLAEEGAMP